jgi:hypothetical protein
MAGRGGFWVIAPAQMDRLLASCQGDDSDEAVLDTMDAVFGELERGSYFDTDKAWDNLHRAYNLDDTEDGLDPEAGDWPFYLLTFGGRQLYFGDDYHLYLIKPDNVAVLASALHEVDEGWLRKRWFSLGPGGYYDIGEDEFGYLTCNTRGLPAFFARAAAAGLAVLFYASL